jgi:hypothetical protein
MHLLGVGRQAFLEFLRNLTPQILLLTLSLALWTQLNFRQFDISNWGSTLAFYSCVLTWLLAVIANMMQFIENYSSTALAPLDVRMAKARRRLPNVASRKAFLWRSIKRFRRLVLFHVVTTMLLVQIGFFAATWFGVRQAVRLLSGQ